MVGCWVIWKERCECIFQDKPLNPSCTVSRINFHLHNIFMSVYLVESTLETNTSSLQVSEKLTTINVDVSFGTFTNEIGTGMVLTSIAGQYVGVEGTYAVGVIDAEAGQWIKS